mgnify:CR=1 FL=1
MKQCTCLGKLCMVCKHDIHMILGGVSRLGEDVFDPVLEYHEMFYALCIRVPLCSYQGCAVDHVVHVGPYIFHKHSCLFSPNGSPNVVVDESWIEDSLTIS